jgi:PilZ domain-containing protein
MPDYHDAAGLIARLPSCVELPADFFERSGAVGTHWNDTRQFPRFYFRTAAALEIEQSLPALRRSERQERVYVKDISRVGVAILHSEQLFPGEKLRLIFVDGIERTTTVIRCRRIQPNCFEVAARFDGVDVAQG